MNKPSYDDLVQALRAFDPGPAPCDCCELRSGPENGDYWTCTCECQNRGDLADAAAWANEANNFERIAQPLLKDIK